MPTGLWTDRNNYASSFAGGSGTASDPYLISTPAQLARIAATGYNSGYYYKLTADLDMSEHYWKPIGNSDSGINGCHCYFDGDGHTIQNLYFQYISGVSKYGLFRHLRQGYIQNLTINNADFSAVISRTSSVGYCGALAGGTGYEDVSVELRENVDTGHEYVYARLYGGAIPTVTNCHVKNSTIGGGSSNGGLIGQAYGLDCLSCGVSDSTIKTGYCGGLIGEALLDGLPSAISHTDEAWHCIDSASVENVTLMPTRSCGGLIGFLEYSYLWTTTNYDNGIGEDSYYEWSPFMIEYCTVENLVCDMSNISYSGFEASGLIGAVSTYIGDMGSLNPSYEWMTGIAQINIAHTVIKSMTCIDPQQTCYFSIAIPNDVSGLNSYTAGYNSTNRYSVFSENETTYTDRKAYTKNIIYRDGEAELAPFATGVSTHERCSNNHIVFDFVTGQQNYYMKSSSTLVEGELYYMNSNGNIVAVTDRGYKNDSGAII